jgi:hypothetical protein
MDEVDFLFDSFKNLYRYRNSLPLCYLVFFKGLLTWRKFKNCPLPYLSHVFATMCAVNDPYLFPHVCCHCYETANLSLWIFIVFLYQKRQYCWRRLLMEKSAYRQFSGFYSSYMFLRAYVTRGLLVCTRKNVLFPPIQKQIFEISGWVWNENAGNERRNQRNSRKRTPCSFYINHFVSN